MTINKNIEGVTLVEASSGEVSRQAYSWCWLLGLDHMVVKICAGKKMHAGNRKSRQTANSWPCCERGICNCQTLCLPSLPPLLGRRQLSVDLAEPGSEFWMFQTVRILVRRRCFERTPRRRARPRRPCVCSQCAGQLTCW